MVQRLTRGRATSESHRRILRDQELGFNTTLCFSRFQVADPAWQALQNLFKPLHHLLPLKTSSQPLHNLFITSSKPLHNLFTNSSLLLHYLFKTSSKPLHHLSVFKTSSPPLPNLFTTSESSPPLHHLFSASSAPHHHLFKPIQR